jgi:hypothetical protein
MATLNSALHLNGQTKTELDHLVRRVAQRVSHAANFLDVRAVPSNWPGGPPDNLNGVRPHVSALEWKSMKWREATWYVLNGDGLSSSVSRQACNALARRAKLGDGSFYVVAPRALAAKVKAWADEHRIRVTSFWIFSDR